MPGDSRSDGLAMIQSLKRNYPQLSIIVLTQIQNAGILQSLLQLGVSGILLKKPSSVNYLMRSAMSYLVKNILVIL